MSKKKRVQNEAVLPNIPADVMLAPMPMDGADMEKFFNGVADAIGLGGGTNPVGLNPFGTAVPGTAQVEQTGTIFKNLRYYLISNMRQVLNQAYAELGLVQTICDVPVDDALRGGVTIKTKQLEESQIEELKASMDRDDDLSVVGQAAKWNRLFGGAGVLILTDQDPEEPFDPALIGENDELTFRAVDMWELFWSLQNADGWDPALQSEDNIEFYDYYGQRVHKTRVMRLKGIEAPSFIRPRLRGWGVSVVETLVRSINQYLKGTDLMFEVMDEFKVDIYKIKNFVQALASPQATEAIKRRIQLANWQKNYQNALTMDTEDDWDHKQLSFSGLAEIMLQIRMQVAADMRMPMTKLFGISSAGFNSGEDDIEVYNAMVESQVRNRIKPVTLRMIEIKCQQLFGFIPDDLSATFAPLRIMSSEQEQTVKTQKASTTVQLFQAGAITIKELRDNVNKAGLLDITLDVEQSDMLTGYDDNTTSDEGESEDEDESGTNPDSENAEPSVRKTPKDTRDLPPDPKDKQAPTRPTKERNRHTNARLIVMPRPYSRVDLAMRVMNSALFDRKSYETEGGDGWIDKRRELFFDRDKASDKALWDKASRASQKALGTIRWQFVVWYYKKFGGSFGV